MVEGAKGMKNIWFFVGCILFVMGIIVFAAGIYDLFHPFDGNIVLAKTHANIWWGVIITVVGAVYLFKNKNKVVG